ncbi:MAG: tyrosine-type recombinase/integrase [Bacteroidota bacterium]|nr:tyrosine-type recombinase/integrase [Bacteroidota bacterium]
MANYNFNLRKKSSKKLTPVNLIIRYNNNKLVYSTLEKIHPKFWQGDVTKKGFQRAIETKLFPEFPEFNLRLDKIESQAKTIFREFLNDNDNRLPTPLELRSLLDIKLRRTDVNIKSNKKLSFYDFAEKFIEESKNKVNIKTGKKFSVYTILGYKNTLKTIRDFSDEYAIKTDFDTIDLDWYYKYVEFLSKRLLLATNSIGNKIKILKTFLNDASERGINENYFFRSKKFRKTTELRDEIYITDDELIQIEKLDLSNNSRLEQVRDSFLISCYTGFRYSDLSNLKKENIEDGLIQLRAVKTGQLIIVPVHKTVKKIIEKYSEKTYTSLPKILSNVKMNKYIKEVGKLIPAFNVEVTRGYTKGGIYIEETKMKYELIKTHTARRSFSTNAYKSGVPASVIMKATGHKTESSFMKYLKTSQLEDAQLLQNYWAKDGKI